MAVNCDPSTLAANAVCFASCIPDGMQAAVQTYLLAQLAATTAGTSTDPQVLLTAAAPFAKLFGMEGAVQAYLLCQIANASGA